MAKQCTAASCLEQENILLFACKWFRVLWCLTLSSSEIDNGFKQLEDSTRVQEQQRYCRRKVTTVKEDRAARLA